MPCHARKRSANALFITSAGSALRLEVGHDRLDAELHHCQSGRHLNWYARKSVPPGELSLLLVLMQELNHNGLSSLLDPLR